MCAEGHGVKVFAKGDKHEGGYLNDKRSGFARDKHEGGYLNDKRSGFGAYLL
ncbi:hypothetical protein JKP88DRAFT_285167 [Tribonema minus]|uniref:Uncharacterized protein n=1 Tax=Tribonema minus TaxID=303371 RepID=A0A835ZD44_9STRA|nr:hypothetical protein JKP88DRAFT_285167 [Tribonema minus]